MAQGKLSYAEKGRPGCKGKFPLLSPWILISQSPPSSGPRRDVPRLYTEGGLSRKGLVHANAVGKGCKEAFAADAKLSKISVHRNVYEKALHTRVDTKEREKSAAKGAGIGR